ncbi:FtsB family cell division protein [Oleiharenicola lentus]|uniref:FtsB family cell division protein n=1 Tax=Oleiharenicola lentus TaxID=2508720 RepID=UPI003F6677BB
MNLRNLIIGFYTVLFIAVGLWAVVFFLQIHRDVTAMKAQEKSNQLRLAQAEAKLLKQQQYLDRLLHDPALVERIIREKMRYARANEFIFRFEEDPNEAKP